MFGSIKELKKSQSFKVVALALVLTYICDFVVGPQQARAQALPMAANVLNLPTPGQMVPLSEPFMPLTIQGITLHPEDPLQFDFIVHQGDQQFSSEESYLEESRRLIKYFLASLTVPDEQMWVNLSPYEQDRVIPETFGQTEMGRDALAQDYMLKQVTASLMYPESPVGEMLWKKIYARLDAQYRRQDVPLDTFNKVWIVPEKAVVFEKDNSAFVVESRLKVMLDKDYLAMDKNARKHGLSDGDVARRGQMLTEEFADVVREVIIPEIEYEINHGRNFAPVRQIFEAMILADWYKKNLKDSLLGQAYVGRNKIKGVDVSDKQVKDKIYARYLEAFKTGVFNYIKEDYDPRTGDIVPRQYFSGGWELGNPKTIVINGDEGMLTGRQRERLRSHFKKLRVNLVEYTRRNYQEARNWMRALPDRAHQELQTLKTAAHRIPQRLQTGLQAISHGPVAAGIAGGALLALSGILFPDTTAMMPFAQAGIFGGIIGSLGKVHEYALSYKRIMVGRKPGPYDLPVLGIIGALLVSFNVFSWVQMDRASPQLPSLTEKVVSLKRPYEEMNGIRSSGVNKNTVILPGGAVSAPLSDDQIQKLYQDYTQWEPSFIKNAEQDLRHPDENVRLAAIDFLLGVPEYTPSLEAQGLLIRLTQGYSRVSQKAAALLVKTAERGIRIEGQKTSPLKDIVPAVQPPLSDASTEQMSPGAIEALQNVLGQAMDDVLFAQEVSSDSLKQLYTLFEAQPVLRQEAQRVIQAGGWSFDISRIRELPGWVFLLLMAVVIPVVFPYLQARRRTSLKGFSPSYQRTYTALQFLILGSVLFQAGVMTQNVAQKSFFRAAEPVYYKFVDVKGGQYLKPPSVEQAEGGVPNQIQWLKASPDYNKTAGALISHIAQNPADPEPQAFYLLSQIFDTNLNAIEGPDWNNILAIFYSSDDVVGQFRLFLSEQSQRLHDMTGQEMTADLTRLQQMPAASKAALVKEFTLSVVARQFSGYSEPVQSAAMKMLWFMQSDIWPYRQSFEAHPLFDSVLYQYAYANAFDADLADKITDGLREGSLHLISMPQIEKDYQHHALRDFLSRGGFVYRIPKIQADVPVISVLTNISEFEAQELKAARFLVIGAKDIQAVQMLQRQLYHGAGGDVFQNLDRDQQDRIWQQLRTINDYFQSQRVAPMPEQDSSAEGADMMIPGLGLLFGMIGGSGLLWLQAARNRNKFLQRQAEMESERRSTFTFESRWWEIFSLVLLSIGTVSASSVFFQQQEQAILNRSSVPAAVFYNDLTQASYEKAVKNPYYLLLRRRLESADASVDDVRWAGELGDDFLVPLLIKIKDLDPDPAKRKAAQEALAVLQQKKSEPFSRRLQDFEMLRQRPEFQELATPLNQNREAGLTARLYEDIVGQNDQDAQSLVDFLARINPDEAASILRDFLKTNPDAAHEFSRDLWDAVQKNPDKDGEWAFGLAFKFFQETFLGKTVPLGRNGEVLQALEASGLEAGEDFQQWKNYVQGLGWSAGLAHAMLALVVLALGRTWISRRAQTAEGIQTIARFNTPGTNNTDFWDQFVALEEQEETADAAKILMSAYLDLYQSLQSEESGRNKAVLQDQMTALTTALSRRIKKTTTTQAGLLNAWADMMQEFPGYYDVLYKMISESDLGKAGSDQSVESLAVRVYEEALQRMMTIVKDLSEKTAVKESGEGEKGDSDEDDGESEEEQEQRRQNRITRRHLLAGLIAAKALRDADSQEARDVLQKAVLANENKLLKQTKEIEKQKMSGFTNGDQLWRGLKREDVKFEKYSDGVLSRGLSSLRDLANGGSFDVNRYMRLVVMQARMDGDDGAPSTSDGENETGDKAMMVGERKDWPGLKWRTYITRTLIALMGFQALPPPVPSGAFARDPSRSPRPALVPDNQNWALKQKLRYSQDDQYSASHIHKLLEEVKANPAVIPSKISVLPGIVRSVRDNPETALAVSQLIGIMRSQLNESTQGTLDGLIFRDLMPYIGHSSQSAADMARTYLVLSRVSNVKGVLLGSMGNDPHRIAGIVEILGYRHEGIEEIYKIGNKTNTPLIYEACFDALVRASGKKFFLTEEEMRAVTGFFRGFGRLPDNAFERLEFKTGFAGNDQDRRYYQLGGRGWGFEFENTLSEVEEIRQEVTTDTVFVFGQPQIITDTTETKYKTLSRNWQPVGKTAVRLNLPNGLFPMLMNIFRSPFKNHALEYVSEIIKESNNPSKRIAGIQRLAQVESEDAVKHLFVLMREQNKLVSREAFQGLRLNAQQQFVHQHLRKQHGKINPGFLRKAANKVFKVFRDAFGLYAQRELMGLYDKERVYTQNGLVYSEGTVTTPDGEVYIDDGAHLEAGEYVESGEYNNIVKGIGTVGDLMERVTNGQNMFSAAIDTGSEYWLSEKIASFMRTVTGPFKIITDLFFAEMGAKWRKEEIQRLRQDPDPTTAYRYMAFLFAAGGDRKDIPVMLAMFQSRDPIVHAFARDGLRRLNYKFDLIKIQRVYLMSGNLERQAMGVAWLGAAGTRGAVLALEAKYNIASHASLKAEIITALADIARDGTASAEASAALERIARQLEGKTDDVSKGMRLHFGEQVRGIKEQAGSGVLARMAGRFSGEAGGASGTKIFDSREQQTADQTKREKRARQPFYAGGLKIDPQNPGSQDVAHAAAVFESSLESAGVMGLRQQLRLLEYFDGLARHGQIVDRDRQRMIDVCRSVMKRGGMEVQVKALRLWARLSPQTLLKEFPAESYRVPDYSQEFLLTVRLWNTKRQFLNEEGNAVDFDRLAEKARRQTNVLPYDLMWAAKKGVLLDLLIEAIQVIASIDTAEAEMALIQLAEDKNFALSGYAVAVLLERNQMTQDPKTLNRLGAAVATALDHDYWPVRQQVLQELLVYVNELNRHLDAIGRGDAVGASSDQLIDLPHEIRTQLKAFDIIMGKALGDNIDPDSEGVAVIRRFAVRVKALLENSQGVRPKDLVMNDRNAGRVNFENPDHDPRLMIAEEEAERLKRKIIAQTLLSSAVLYPKSFKSVMESMSDLELSPAERALVSQAAAVMEPLTASQKQEMLKSLVETKPRVLKVTIQTALSQGIRAEKIKEKFVHIIHHPAQFSPENLVSASYGLAYLMERGDIASNDLRVYFAFNELRKDDDIEVRTQGLRGLLKMSLTNEALDLMTPQQKRVLEQDLKQILAQTRLEGMVVVEGRSRFVEEVVLEPLLPFNLVKDQGNKPSLKMIRSGSIFLMTHLGLLEASDRRAQTNAFAHIQSRIFEERKMGYEMLRDLVKFAHPQYFDITRIILTLIQSANTEEQQEARMELAQTLGNGNFKTNLNALTSGLSDQDLIRFYEGLFGALNRASASEWENYIRILDLKVLDDFDGRPHLASSRADLYLRILEDPRRMRVLRDAGHLGAIFQTIDQDLKTLSGLISGHAPTDVRIYWTQRLKLLQERRAGVWNGNDAQQKRDKVRREYLQGRPLGQIESVIPSTDETSDAASLGKPERTGGIDLRPAGFETQILRNSDGIALPLPQQSPEILMNIEGFIPVIINQAPVSVPQLLGLKDVEPSSEWMSPTAETAGTGGREALPWSRRRKGPADEQIPYARLKRHPAYEGFMAG